jgi:hypothetical protein
MSHDVVALMGLTEEAREVYDRAFDYLLRQKQSSSSSSSSSSPSSLSATPSELEVLDGADVRLFFISAKRPRQQLATIWSCHTVITLWFSLLSFPVLATENQFP